MMKRFLDGNVILDRVAVMKNLLRLGAVLIVSAICSSCGAPMAAIRTLKNTPQSVTNAYTTLLE